MIIKLAIALVIVLIVAGFASWAFLPARYLPGNRARHLRIRLHLRLHPGMIAGLAGRPASTVRGWLRRFAGRAEEVRVFFTGLLARVAPDPVMPAGAAGAVAAAVSAIAGAASAVAARWPELGEVPVWAAASAASCGRLLAPGWP